MEANAFTKVNRINLCLRNWVGQMIPGALSMT